MRKIKIIIKFCEKYNIDFNSLFWLIDNVKNKNNTLVIDYIVDKAVLEDALLIKNNLPTEKGKRTILDLLDDLEDKSKATKKSTDDTIIEINIEEFVDEYRKLFKGYKLGSMGDKKGCIAKFKIFFKEYPEFTNKELILRATKMYINSVNNPIYLKRADYFIFKSDAFKSRESMLATYCEEVDMDKPEIHDKYQML